MQYQVSEVQICPIKHHEGLVAFASLIFNDSFYLGSIGINTRPQGGLRLSYPTRKISDHNIPIFHPINKDVANLIEQEVISKLEEVYSAAK